MRQSSLDLFHSHRRLRALNKPIYLPINLNQKNTAIVIKIHITAHVRSLSSFGLNLAEI